MKLSDRDIIEMMQARYLVVTPSPSWNNIQPASLDLHLGNEFLEYHRKNMETEDLDKVFIDIRDEKTLPQSETFHLQDDQYHVLWPQAFVLGTSREHIRVEGKIVGELHGRSTLGRLGILTHACAGLIDPGFQGHITFHIANVGPNPIKLFPGMKIAHVSFSSCHLPPARAYRGKYQGQVGPTPARPDLDV